MKGFKVLGIRILTSTDDSFVNNLEKGIIYKFYQNYSFHDEDNHEIKKENGNLDKIKVKVIPPQKNNLDLYSSSDKFANIF